MLYHCPMAHVLHTDIAFPINSCLDCHYRTVPNSHATVTWDLSCRVESEIFKKTLYFTIRFDAALGSCVVEWLLCFVLYLFLVCHWSALISRFHLFCSNRRYILINDEDISISCIVYVDIYLAVSQQLYFKKLQLHHSDNVSRVPCCPCCMSGGGDCEPQGRWSVIRLNT